jgi:8-oxo-dGTP diphosphatase
MTLVFSMSARQRALSLLLAAERIIVSGGGKMARSEIMAAGGIVVRGTHTPLIAVVQRRKDDWWVLPKGKLKRNEAAVAAAKREVVEETGLDVTVHEFLGAMSYEVNSGPKLVQFWRMQALEGPERKLTDDIKAVKWLPLERAIEKLDSPVERMFLRGIGDHVVGPPAVQDVGVLAAAITTASQPNWLQRLVQWFPHFSSVARQDAPR